MVESQLALGAVQRGEHLEEHLADVVDVVELGGVYALQGDEGRGQGQPGRERVVRGRRLEAGR